MAVSAVIRSAQSPGGIYRLPQDLRAHFLAQRIGCHQVYCTAHWIMPDSATMLPQQRETQHA
jgi:hypothetical protein